jgi:hypothetical protein
MRKVDVCLSCQETKEIAALGLCFACYRRVERQTKRAKNPPDLHNPAIKAKHKKILRGFANLLAALGDLGVNRADVMAIRKIIDQYVMEVQPFLNEPHFTVGEFLQEQHDERMNGRSRLGEDTEDDTEVSDEVPDESDSSEP